MKYDNVPENKLPITQIMNNSEQCNIILRIIVYVSMYLHCNYCFYIFCIDIPLAYQYTLSHDRVISRYILEVLISS